MFELIKFIWGLIQVLILITVCSAIVAMTETPDDKLWAKAYKWIDRRL